MENRIIERLPDAELDIMRAVWDEGKPISAGAIVKKLSSVRKWKLATAHVLLNRLCARGFLSADKSGYQYLFSALISEKEYRGTETASFFKRVCNGSLENLAAALIGADDITDSELDELSELLRRKDR